MSKYKFTYFLNTACAERRPQTRRDLIEDWKEEEREFPLDIEAFEYVFKEILEGDEDELLDIYEELPDQDDLTKINRLKEIFDEEAEDPGMGNTILISIEGPGQTYNSGYSKEDFNTDFEDDDDYNDDDYLDENKNLNEDEQLEIDEKGLPVLERPYSIRKRDDNRFQITSSHPYDLTDYCYAISESDDINGNWKVYDPGRKHYTPTINGLSRNTLEGIFKGWNEALDKIKESDSKKEPRIDRT